jgi:Flp pilus assembly pilin Flp
MMIKLLTRLLREETGGETLEYAVVTTLVILAGLGALKSVGTKVLARWTSLNSSL